MFIVLFFCLGKRFPRLEILYLIMFLYYVLCLTCRLNEKEQKMREE